MRRARLTFLQEWLKSPKGKPVVIHGARQVGKTWLVRELCRVEKKEIIEINFEKRSDWAQLFVSNDPHQILVQLEAVVKKKIDPAKALLFLDEIQVVPELLAKGKSDC